MILTEKGRFQSAAKHQEDIASIYETELIDLDKAMNAYEVAADWYSAEASTAYVLIFNTVFCCLYKTIPVMDLATITHLWSFIL